MKLFNTEIPDNMCIKCYSEMKESTLIANYHNIQHPHDNSKSEFETNYEKCMKCISCGHSYTLEIKADLPSKEKQVDFELLNKTCNIQYSKNDFWNNLTNIISNKECGNLYLFFKKLSTSSSFAHLAHKELKKLS